ncbi:hypothetical protein LOZ58_000378 [Ophidiomyces ophidiicola]|nr:hypothetical protein LOZ58_000378 [Ophidiomyces ophidiicola]
MVNYCRSGLNTIVEKVQIIDLENADHLSKGRCIKGMLAGNDSWRSPEGHFKGELNKSSDIFSFAAVMKKSTAKSWDSFGMIEWQTIIPTDRSQSGRMSLNDFKDLILRMTNMDPQKWTTAREALEHPWFAGCEID